MQSLYGEPERGYRFSKSAFFICKNIVGNLPINYRPRAWTARTGRPSDMRFAVYEVNTVDLRNLEGSLPGLGSSKKLRVVSPVYQVICENGSTIVRIEHNAISAERYPKLYVFCTRTVGEKPVLLPSNSTKENEWTYDGVTFVKISHSVAQLFVCGARDVHEKLIVNEHGGTVRGDFGASGSVMSSRSPSKRWETYAAGLASSYLRSLTLNKWPFRTEDT